MPACDWEILECGECARLDGLDAEVRAEVEAWAIDRLWEWTRERFGLCETTAHSDDPACCGATLWSQLRMAGCSSSEMILPGPIAEVISANINGEELGPEAFHVDNYNILVRDDGGIFTGDWEVVYLRGEPVPPGGGLVAWVLACEYAKRVCNDDSCRLPKRLRVAQRQGLTLQQMENFLQNPSEGFTGIWEIDDWILAQNKPMRQSSVSSPDVPKHRIVTWAPSESS